MVDSRHDEGMLLERRSCLASDIFALQGITEGGEVTMHRTFTYICCGGGWIPAHSARNESPPRRTWLKQKAYCEFGQNSPHVYLSPSPLGPDNGLRKRPQNSPNLHLSIRSIK